MTARKEESKRVGTVVACATLAVLCGAAAWFTRAHLRGSKAALTSSEMNAAVCETSVLKLKTPYTTEREVDGTDTGVYFCNGADKGCTRLDRKDINDFSPGKTNTYTVNTEGGQSGWFCLCGTRDSWMGELKAVNLCGFQKELDLWSRAEKFKVSIDPSDFNAQCARFSGNPIKRWIRATWAQCQLNMYELTLETKSSSAKDYSDSALKLMVAGSDASAHINRWDVNDFKRGSVKIFRITMPALLSDEFIICTDSSSTYVGELWRITAPIAENFRVVLAPKADSVEFKIAKKDDPASEIDDCAVFAVDRSDNSFEFTGTVKSDSPDFPSQ